MIFSHPNGKNIKYSILLCSSGKHTRTLHRGLLILGFGEEIEYNKIGL